MTMTTYYMYPCDTCRMISKRIRDKWLILSHVSKGPLKSNNEDKKGINEKKKKRRHFLFFWA